jgi:tetratricopeptide (TPR) repeat protein
MPTYVWRFKDRAGNCALKEVTSDTVEESKSLLVAEGCTEFELMTDDVMSAATSGMAKDVTLFDQKIKITETDKLKSRNKKPATFLRAIWEGAMQSKGFVLVALAVGAWQAYRHSTAGVVFAGIGLMAWLAFILVVSLPSIYYARLHKASDWNRWDEMLELVERLKAIGKFHFIKVPGPELGRMRAIALAGKGQLDQALREYAAFENQPGCPRWLYMAYVASLYDVAKQYDRGVEWTQKAIQEKNNPVLYLDLANRYARYKRDATQARAALTEAEKGTIPQPIKSGHHRCRGVVAYVEGDYAAAKKELETALEILAGVPHQPFRDGNMAIARGYLACALARLGDQGGARENYRAARDYLIATHANDLLGESRQLSLN